MIGYLNKKLYIAVLGNGVKEISNMTDTIHSWYKDIKVKSYTDSISFFESISLNKLQNHPFDAVYVNSEQKAEKMILNRTIPELPVFTYNNSTK